MIKKIFGLLLTISALLTPLFFSSPASAASFSLSPMNQVIQLTPGEEYSGSFDIKNPSSTAFEYRLEATPFWVDANYNIIYDSQQKYSRIANWITIPEPTGEVPASSSKTVNFTIAPPEGATGGGQYLMIKVTSRDGGTTETASGTKTAYSMGHVIYAEVSGEDVKPVLSLSDASLPHFLLSAPSKKADKNNPAKSGKIFATATVSNTGNTLATTSLVLEAYPLFSNKPAYSNISSPETYKILPETSRKVTLIWEDTPAFGIFKLIYRIYLGTEPAAEKEAFVILLPLWFVILLPVLIITLIGTLIYIKKRRKNASQPKSDTVVEL